MSNDDKDDWIIALFVIACLFGFIFGFGWIVNGWNGSGFADLSLVWTNFYIFITMIIIAYLIAEIQFFTDPKLKKKKLDFCDFLKDNLQALLVCSFICFIVCGYIHIFKWMYLRWGWDSLITPALIISFVGIKYVLWYYILKNKKEGKKRK